MNRKDYIVIAGIISLAIEEAEDNEHALRIVNGLAARIADYFYEDNDNFDYHRFYDACGIK